MPLKLRIQPPQGDAFQRECDGPTVVVGRSAKADIVVPDRFMSRLHARFSRAEGGWFVEDLAAKNTTLVNGQPVEGRKPVAAGDSVQLADTVVVVEAPAGGAGPSESAIFRPAATLLGLPAAQDGGRLRLLNEVHRALAAPISLEDLLALVLERAFDVLRPEEGVILLRRGDGRFERAATRREPGFAGAFLDSRSLLHEVAERGMAALVADASADLRFAGSDSILGSGVRSIVAAPLAHADGCAGMIALSSRAHVKRFAEEDMELLAALASAAALRIRNLALAEEAAERRVLEKELALAHDIQMALLPRRFPCRAELELAAALRPAKSVGGDVYDFVEDASRLWFLVGDVSGKGVGAALFMAVAKTLFRAMVQAEPSPAEALARINRELARDNERAMFVTAFAGRLDLATGEVDFANAGHNPPYLLRSDGGLAPVTAAHGLALGILPDHAYQPGRLTLAPGDSLFLYTDGVVEQPAPGGEAFGQARLERHLAAAGRGGSADLVQGTLAALERFMGDAPQFDDLTMLSLKYRARPEEVSR